MPLVLKWLVDGPPTSGDASGIWLGGLVLVLLGAAEAGIFGVRRWLTARPLAEVEASMREALYRRLQRLPIAFHDRWSSGQLLSRGIADLGLVRGFLSLPLTFLTVNAVTFVAGAVILLKQQWRSSRWPGRSVRTSSSVTCPTGTTATSGPAATGSPPGSGSRWRWPALCWPTRPW
jgi:ABC-type multidrug transport system fused ATPase/permease subunit